MIDATTLKIRDEEDRRVVAALCEVGIAVSSVYDLVNTKKAYPEAIPSLLRMLPIIHESVIKEGIVRALTVKEARGVAAKPLIREFASISPQNSQSEQVLKWTIGNALSVVADDRVFEEIVQLATDKRHGQARTMVVVALSNMQNPKAVDVLLELLNDPEVDANAVIALGKLKAQKARKSLTPFLKHPKAWVRKEAQRALEKIDKANYRK